MPFKINDMVVSNADLISRRPRPNYNPNVSISSTDVFIPKGTKGWIRMVTTAPIEEANSYEYAIYWENYPMTVVYPNQLEMIQE
jgi:hypothetical protein